VSHIDYIKIISIKSIIYI